MWAEGGREDSLRRQCLSRDLDDEKKLAWKACRLDVPGRTAPVLTASSKV